MENGDRIREACGLIQEELADRIEVRRPAMNGWETAKRDPGRDKRPRIAKVRGHSALWIEFGDGRIVGMQASEEERMQWSETAQTQRISLQDILNCLTEIDRRSVRALREHVLGLDGGTQRLRELDQEAQAYRDLLAELVHRNA